MTTTPGNPYVSSRPRSTDWRLARELLAVALIVLGVAGLVVAAFTFDVRAGIAVGSVVLIAAGVFLGLDR